MADGPGTAEVVESIGRADNAYIVPAADKTCSRLRRAVLGRSLTPQALAEFMEIERRYLGRAWLLLALAQRSEPGPREGTISLSYDTAEDASADLALRSGASDMKSFQQLRPYGDFAFRTTDSDASGNVITISATDPENGMLDMVQLGTVSDLVFALC